MHRFRGVLVLSVVSLFAFGMLAAPEKEMELPSQAFDRAGHQQRMVDLQKRLSGSMVDLARDHVLEISVTPEQRRSISEGRATEKKMRVGLVSEVSIPVEFDRGRITARREQLHDTLGALRGDADGSFAWTAVARARDAAALRIHFVDFDLPAGAELYVHTRGGMAFGPYTGRGPNGNGDFWTNTVAGEELVLQLQGGKVGEPRFTVAGVAYLTEEFALAASLAPRAEVEASVKNCSFNANCVQGAGCGTSSAVNTAKQAVAHMLFASGGFLYICSGGLVADSVTTSQIPYFLTANHCIRRSSEASSLEAFFLYTSSCGACPDPTGPTTNGSTIVATNRTSDYTLLRLSQAAPTGTAFLGWNSTAVANSNNTPLYRISHPQGAPQSYSEHVVDTSKPTCSSWPRGNWIYSRDTYGATEGGSSGSPVVNSSGQIVGQLSGACGTNVNDECDPVRNATVDGAFAAYYPAIASILGSGGGGGGCTDADGDGHCSTATGGDDCNDGNRNIYPGHSEKGKWGRDGLDNDCDGLIDA
jgi:V8-like Glu-specific endopeptidase